jgi:hypothetical protein
MHGYLNACVGERECARIAQGSVYRVNGRLRSVKQIRHITDFDDKLNSAMHFEPDFIECFRGPHLQPVEREVIVTRGRSDEVLRDAQAR